MELIKGGKYEGFGFPGSRRIAWLGFLSVLLLTGACQLPSFADKEGRDSLRLERSELFKFEGWITALAFSQGGHALAVGGCQDSSSTDRDALGRCSQGVMQVWNLKQARLETSLTFPSSVTALAVSPDGKLWIVGDSEGRLILSTSLKAAAKPFHQKSTIKALAFSPDGKWIASGSLDQSFPLAFMDASTGGVIKVKRKFETVSALAFSPDGKSLVVGMTRGGLVMWDYGSQTSPLQIASNSDEKNAITSVSFSPDGLLLVYGRYDGRVIILDRTTGQSIREFSGGSSINALVFSPDGRYLAVGQDSGKVFLVESRQAREIWSSRLMLPVSDLAYSPDGASLAVAVQNSVYLYKVDSTNSPRSAALNNTAEEIRINAKVLLAPN